MPERDDIKWGMARRFEFLEWRIYWTGRFNRKDLEERFGVSTPQASIDLKTYQEIAPDNIWYNATEKAFLPAQEFNPAFLNISADRYLLQLDAILNRAVDPSDTWFSSPPPATVVENITRSVHPATLRSILRAIQNREELSITYQSLTNTRSRTIAPHAIAYDGNRWHARAWCPERDEFRDFVLTRIQSVTNIKPSNSNPSDDVEWNTFAEIEIIPHPGLEDAQKSAIAADFGMTDGHKSIRTRLALCFYIVKRLNLDIPDESLPPERKQITATNLESLTNLQNAARAESARLVAMRKMTG